MSQSEQLSASHTEIHSRSPAVVVARYLESFSSRQSLFQIIRGSAAALVGLLSGACLLMVTDWSIPLADAWRWLLTCSLYATSIILGWRAGFYCLFLRPSPVSVAWSVEHACPALQEKLLSAVELRRSDGTSRSGSPAFVDAIERDVAQELISFEINSILPWQAVSKAIVAISIAFCVVFFFCNLPGARFPERFARALLPFVSVDRVLNVRITVLEPGLDSLQIPSDQIVPFAIQLTGASSVAATLELIEQNASEKDAGSRTRDKRRLLKMDLVSDSPLRYSLSAPIFDRPMKFRFLAGDATTNFQTIQPLVRPGVLAFHREIEPPAYAHGSKEIGSSPRGELNALKGSSVKLVIDVDHRLFQASMEMEFLASGRKESILLQPLSTQTFSADLVIEEDMQYQVRLISEISYKGNRIENIYSPRYEINSIEDTPPSVSWNVCDKSVWSVPPKSNQSFIVAHDEIVHLSARVSDDLPIDQLLHQASVNGGEWITLLPKLGLSEMDMNDSTEEKARTPVQPFFAQSEWVWDLLGHDARSGDSVATRVLSVDRKGNIAYSPTLTFNLAEEGFDRDRYRGLTRRVAIIPLLDSLSDSLNKSRQQVRPKMEKLRDAKLTSNEWDESTAEIRTMLASSAQAARASRSMAESIIKELGRCIDQSEMELVVRLVSRVEREWLSTIANCIDQPFQHPSSNTEPNSVTWFQKERVLRIDRMVQSYDAACDNSKRCSDIYKQFVGLELQASLTMELTHLRDHQERSVHRQPPGDFRLLARSQQIAEQYMDAIVPLASLVEPYLAEDFRNRLAELKQWVDRTRTETRDLLTQEPSERANKALRTRLEQSISELKAVRWAFALQGGLMWEVVKARRELMIRSGTLFPSFERFSDVHRRRSQVNQEKSIDTNEQLLRNKLLFREVTGPIVSALEQILDRRDVHQKRTLTDPMFASDMGMAFRAWTNILELWVSEPMNANQLFSDAQSIAKAYRILEAAHETVEARMAVQSLLPIEQYEWQKLEGQLMNPRLWDSVDSRLEVAHQWMREAGFPDSVVEKYDSLRWSEPTRGVNDRLNPRRQPDNGMLFSGADDLRSLLVLWSDADKAAKPTLDDARAILAKFSPSVARLAKQAASTTKSIQRLTEEMKSNRPESDKGRDPDNPRPIPSQEQVQRERDANAHSISQLKDALIENANKQDLLNQAEQNVAQDSDRALVLLDSVLQRMDDAIDQALGASLDNSEDRDTKLDGAIRREADSVKALDKIADHFERLANSPNGAEIDPRLSLSSAELAKMAAEAVNENSQTANSALLQSQNEGYARASELTDLANNDAETLLLKLESELKRNPTMQQELSEISKSNAESLAAELQNAGLTEELLASQLEIGDAELSGEKRFIVDQLRASAEQVDRLSARLLDQTRRAWQKAGANQPTTPLDQANRQLRSASQAARNLSDDTRVRDVKSASQRLTESLEQTLKLIQSSGQEIPSAAEPQNGIDEKKRLIDRKEMQNLQSQFRNEMLHQAREYASHSQRQSDVAKKRLQQSQAELERAQKGRQLAQKERDKHPGNASTSDALRQATNAMEEAVVRKNWQEKVTDQSKSMAALAKDQVSALEGSERADLDRPNPQAALTVEQLAKAEEQVKQLLGKSNRLYESVDQLPTPSTSSSTLAAEVREQQHIQEKVREVADQLRRSSRHEGRLGNVPGAKDLMSQSSNIDQLASGSVGQARVTLEENLRAASQSEGMQSDSAGSEASIEAFIRPDSGAAQTQLQNAAQDLRSQSKKIAQLLPQTKAGLTEPNAPSSRDEKGYQAREMARMLDLLDRQLNSGSDESSASSQSASSSNEREGPKSSSVPNEGSSQNPASKQGGGDDDRNGTRSAFKDSVKSSAEQLAMSMGKDRLTQKSASQSRSEARSTSSGKQSKGNPLGGGDSGVDLGTDAVLPGMTRVPNRDWGKLRDQRTSDAVEGRRDEYDPEFSEAIQAYYKALGIR